MKKVVAPEREKRAKRRNYQRNNTRKFPVTDGYVCPAGQHQPTIQPKERRHCREGFRNQASEKVPSVAKGWAR